MTTSRSALGQVLTHRTVWIAALGFFVDMFDLVLFGVVRTASLRDIGVPEDQFLNVGSLLLNSQMAGMLIGGILWGVLGDKKGRVSVLFASILLYSVANLANAFVSDVPTYAALRFIAGIGLAGELGAAVTLVSEVLPKEIRGYGTAFIPAFGFLGSISAALTASQVSWKSAYMIGGVLGLVLLFARAKMTESGYYAKLHTQSVSRGNLKQLLGNSERLKRYIRCILIGIPIWCSAGILMTFAPEFAKALEVQGAVTAGNAIMFNYVGGVIGDAASGWLSQWARSRKKIIAAFLALMGLFYIIFFNAQGMSSEFFYSLCILSGIANGYFAVFVTTAAEQFGTNLRATVTTTVPNFVRGSVVVLTLSFQALLKQFSLLQSAALLAAVTLAVAFFALKGMKESFGTSLDFLET